MLASQYITVQELFNAPLGVDFKNIPSQDALVQANYAELQNICQRASALVDNYVHQTLAATVDSEELSTVGRRCGVDSDGYLWVKTAFDPVIALQSFRYGTPALGGTVWTSPNLSDVLILGARSNELLYPGWFQRRDVSRLRVQITYVNGYPNTTLSGSTTIAAGSTSLPLKDLTGVLAGAPLTVYDGANTEVVTAASSWTPTTGAGALVLASPTQAAHTPVPFPTTGTTRPYDISVSALPADVKLAVMLIAKFQVEERGTTALVMGRSGGISGQAEAGKAAEDEIPAEAIEIIGKYERIL